MNSPYWLKPSSSCGMLDRENSREANVGHSFVATLIHNSVPFEKNVASRSSVNGRVASENIVNGNIANESLAYGKIVSENGGIGNVGNRCIANGSKLNENLANGNLARQNIADLSSHNYEWQQEQTDSTEGLSENVDDNVDSLADSFDKQLAMTPECSQVVNTLDECNKDKSLSQQKVNELANADEHTAFDIDVKEVQDIWEELERIVRKSQCERRRRASVQSQCSNNGSVNSIEFMKCFDKEKIKILNQEIRHLFDEYGYIRIPINMMNLESLGQIYPLTNSDVENKSRRSSGASLHWDSSGIYDCLEQRVSSEAGHVARNNGQYDSVDQLRHSAPGRLDLTRVRDGGHMMTSLPPLVEEEDVHGGGGSLRVWKGNAGKMTTTLPRITPMSTSAMSTPLPTGITQPPPRSHSSASIYVPYPPKDLSSSSDFLNIPGRVNPLAPPPPRRRINWSWETTDQHHENEKRRLLMQKREHTRYHSAWAKAFYGAPAEKEAYRRHFRETLKQQMDDKDLMKKEENKSKVRESTQAISYDRECRQNDAQEFFRKHNYLMQYRDTNKSFMEDKWAERRFNKRVENRTDEERLRYNPINWSCSLK